MPNNSSDASVIGLIGVGLLGSAAAERWLASGCEVLGFDLAPERRHVLSASGGTAAESAADVIAGSDVVAFCLPTSRDSLALFDSHAPHFHSGQLVLDLTTGDPRETTKLGRSASALGVDFLETNVAGSSEQLRRGEAVLFVGGTAAAVDRADAILSALASLQFHLGDVGSASRFKLVHNLLLGLHRAALGETLAFAEALGFDAEEALDVLQQTPAASRAMAAKGLKMAAGEYSPQAKLTQHLKDVRLILETANEAGALTPLSQLHCELLERAVALGFGDRDNSAVAEVFRRKQD